MKAGDPGEPNDRLRAVLAEAQWTGQALAQAVNALGARRGLRLRYDRTSVAHWLAGARPRPPVPMLIVDALSHRLGRPLSLDSVALDGEAEPAGGHWEWDHDPVAGLASLADTGSGTHARRIPYDPDGRRILRWPEAVAARLHWQPDQDPLIGNRDVDAASSMLQTFSDADAIFGGGRVRPALATHLATDIAPKLHARYRSAATRRRMFVMAGRMTYLCGFTCFDEGLNGLGQRYYLAALRLAAEAGDVVGYAITLRGLSVQALAMNQRSVALRLAEAACETAPSGISRLISAFLHGQVAVAAAGAGERTAALTRLSTAERQLAKATSRPGAVGAYHYASLGYQTAVALAALGDRANAINALKHSIRARPAAERRSRAMALATLATLQLDHGQLDPATVTWHSFLDEYPHLTCQRVRASLAAMYRQLRPYRQNRAAQAVLRRADAVRTSQPAPVPGSLGHIRAG